MRWFLDIRSQFGSAIWWVWLSNLLHWCADFYIFFAQGEPWIRSGQNGKIDHIVLREPEHRGLGITVILETAHYIISSWYKNLSGYLHGWMKLMSIDPDVVKNWFLKAAFKSTNELVILWLDWTLYVLEDDHVRFCKMLYENTRTTHK